MMLPIAMAQELGAQHRNDMLAASGRWHTRRFARLSRLAVVAGLRRAPQATATQSVSVPAAQAPERSSIEVRRPLVRS
ncbi:MAG: hypothetical protein QOG52_2559 [Frankiaceae bacterium]|nr:hypothetical protein [Frankiaceae bacterium]